MRLHNFQSTTSTIPLDNNYPGYSGYKWMDIGENNKIVPILFSCLHKVDIKYLNNCGDGLNTRFLSFLYADPKVAVDEVALVLSWGFSFTPSAVYSAWINPGDKELMNFFCTSKFIYHFLIDGEICKAWAIKNLSKNKISIAARAINDQKFNSTEEKFTRLCEFGKNNGIIQYAWQQQRLQDANQN